VLDVRGWHKYDGTTQQNNMVSQRVARPSQPMKRKLCSRVLMAPSAAPPGQHQPKDHAPLRVAHFDHGQQSQLAARRRAGRAARANQVFALAVVAVLSAERVGAASKCIASPFEDGKTCPCMPR